jgi:hypothetical protein
VKPRPPALWWIVEPVAVLVSLFVIGVALLTAAELLRRVGELLGGLLR